MRSADLGPKLAYTFAHLAAHLVGIGSVYPTPAYKTPGLLFALRIGTDERRPAVGAVRRGMAVGSPETVIKQLKLWEEIGVDRMVFILNTAEVIPQERVLKSLRLFAEHVMPALSGPKRSGGPAEGPVLDRDARSSRNKPSAGSLAEAATPALSEAEGP